MKDFATIANTTGAFPSTVSENVTSPSAGDGTPFIKQLIDFTFGFAQALMTAAGLTPSGTTESSTISQILNAIRNISGSPGELVPWFGKKGIIPSSMGIRLLALEGQGVLVSSYTALTDIVYVGDSYNATASSFYRADNSDGTSRNTTGIYLILPDARGCFFRGYDPTNANDPQGNLRDLGHYQADAIRDHAHVIRSMTGTYLGNHKNLTYTPGGSVVGYVKMQTTGGDVVADQRWPLPAPNPQDTKPMNLVARWMIRY